jgi:hypothetical protein
VAHELWACAWLLWSILSFGLLTGAASLRGGAAAVRDHASASVMRLAHYLQAVRQLCRAVDVSLGDLSCGEPLSWMCGLTCGAGGLAPGALPSGPSRWGCLRLSGKVCSHKNCLVEAGVVQVSSAEISLPC